MLPAPWRERLDHLHVAKAVSRRGAGGLPDFVPQIKHVTTGTWSQDRLLFAEKAGHDPPEPGIKTTGLDELLGCYAVYPA